MNTPVNSSVTNRHTLRSLLCLILLAIVLRSGEAEATPRLLVEVGEQISAWFSKRGVGCTVSNLDPAILAREVDGAASTGLRLSGLYEAAPLLVHQAHDLLPLARLYGDDFLRLESHVPGLGTEAAARFPHHGDLGRLAALPDYQARQRIFELYLSKLKLDPNLDTSSLAGMTEGKSPGWPTYWTTPFF